MRNPASDRPRALSRLALGGAALVLLALLLPGSEAGAQPVQLAANPFFAEWSGSAPDEWTASGSAIIVRGNDSHDAPRNGPNEHAVVRANSAGAGLAQEAIPVEPTTRYDVYAWVRAPGAAAGQDFQLRVTGEQGAGYVSVAAYSSATPDGWHRLQATFLTGAGETAVDVSFERRGSGASLELWLDDVTLWERTPDPAASQAPLPARPVVLYGLEQDTNSTVEAATMAAFNVFDARYHTPGFVSTLRSRGAVAAKRVYVAEVGVDELVARWTEPFRDTLEGRIANGFDAIIIDEISGWTDFTTKAATIASALEQTRALYPNRQIYVWGDWRLAQGSKHDQILAAINRYADVFILEAYAHELVPQYELAGALADTLAQREIANPAVAGLLEKTTFGLATYQAPHGYTADNTAELDYKAFLDEHFHRIANHAAASRTRGVALFSHYYTPPDTLAWFNALVQHYVVQGKTTYAGPGRQGESPLGRHASLLADNNPSFESHDASWALSGSAEAIMYGRDVPHIPSFHSDDSSPVPHGSSLLRTYRTAGPANSVSQVIAVQPSTTYVFNAYVLGGQAGTAAEISVRNPASPAGWVQTAAFPAIGDAAWTKAGLVFTTPAGVRSVELRISDAPAAPGSLSYWDYAELTAKSTFDTFVPAVVSDVTSLTITWTTDIPTLGSVSLGDSPATARTVPSSTGLATLHRVVLTGLTPATRYAFRTVNEAGSTAVTAYTSTGYASYTRTSTGPVSDASPIPPDVVPPDAPIIASAVLGEGGLRLEWSDDGYDVLGYDVYRAVTAEGALEKINTSLVRDSAYLDEAALDNGRYWYAVRAIDAAGNESAFSQRVTSVREQSRIILPLVAKD